jgi:hypothetical protein
MAVLAFAATATPIIRRDLFEVKPDGGLRHNPSDEQQTGAFAEKQETGTAPQKQMCSLTGDPHVKTFDVDAAGRHDKWHPMFAPGQWWMVNTADRSIQIQGKYSGCGRKTSGGWQAARLNGVPRTCISALAVGGTILGPSAGKHIVVKAACDWDWYNINCTNSPSAGALPNVSYDGHWTASEIAQKVQIDGDHRVTLTLSDNLKIIMNAFGKGSWAPAHSNWNVMIEMVKPATQVCGHCGDFDGNWQNDLTMYEQTGVAKDESNAFCHAYINCADRYIKGDIGCLRETGASFTLADCPEPHLTAFRNLCTSWYQKEHVGTPDQDMLNECIEDTCLGDSSLARIDADQEAAEADEDLQLHH